MRLTDIQRYTLQYTTNNTTLIIAEDSPDNLSADVVILNGFNKESSRLVKLAKRICKKYVVIITAGRQMEKKAICKMIGAVDIKELDDSYFIVWAKDINTRRRLIENRKG